MSVTAASSCISTSVEISEVNDEAMDLRITIKAENDPDTGYFAAAIICTKSTDDKRPTVGVYLLNFDQMEETKLKEYLYFTTYAHEFAHILGFSLDQTAEFVKEDPANPNNRVDIPQTDVVQGRSNSLINRHNNRIKYLQSLSSSFHSRLCKILLSLPYFARCSS